MSTSETKNKLKKAKRLLALTSAMEKPTNFTYVDVVDLNRALIDYINTLTKSLEQVD